MERCQTMLLHVACCMMMMYVCLSVCVFCVLCVPTRLPVAAKEVGSGTVCRGLRPSVAHRPLAMPH
eukprot:301557-Lingulodinium_polyedra.AAC.1